MSQPTGGARPRSSTPLVVGLVVAAVVVAAIVAVFVTGGDDDDAGSAPTIDESIESDESLDTTTGASSAASAGTTTTVDPLAAEVSVDGDPLPFLQEGPDAAVGEPVPALSGADYDGEPVTVAPGEDGPLMVVFLAHWCPHCNDEIPVLNEWRDSGTLPEDLRIVGVSTAVSPDRPNYPPGEWLVEKDWQWDVIADTVPGDGEALAAAEAYGVTGFPFFVFVDADGNVRSRGSGEYPIEQLQALAADVTG